MWAWRFADITAPDLPRGGPRSTSCGPCNSILCVPPDSSEGRPSISATSAAPSWSPASWLRPGKCQRMSGEKYSSCKASMSPRPNAAKASRTRSSLACAMLFPLGQRVTAVGINILPPGALEPVPAAMPTSPAAAVISRKAVDGILGTHRPSPWAYFLWASLTMRQDAVCVEQPAAIMQPREPGRVLSAVCLRQCPALVVITGAGPDLHLCAGSAVAGVVQALAGVGVDQSAIRLRFPDLGAGAVAGVEVH